MSAVQHYPILDSPLADNGARAFDGQTTHLDETRFQLVPGLLASAGPAATDRSARTVSMLLSRLAGATLVRFGDHLQELCEDLAAKFAEPSRPSLSWAIAPADLPTGIAVTFGLVADLLVTSAFVHSFPPRPGRPGRRVVRGRSGRVDTDC